MSFGIIITSIISGMAAMICGCIGIVSDFRDPINGRMRKIGLINIGVLLTGFVFSIAALALGFFKESRENEIAQQRFQDTLDSQQQILRGIKRSMRPLGSPVVSIEIIYEENSGFPGGEMIKIARELQAIPKFVSVETEGVLHLKGRIQDAEIGDNMLLENPVERWNSMFDLIEKTTYAIALIHSDKISDESFKVMKNGEVLENRNIVGAIWESRSIDRKISIKLDTKTNKIHFFFAPEQYSWIWSDGSISYFEDIKDTQWYIESPFLSQDLSGISVIARVRLGSRQGVHLFNELTLSNWSLIDSVAADGDKRFLWTTKVSAAQIFSSFGD